MDGSLVTCDTNGCTATVKTNTYNYVTAKPSEPSPPPDNTNNGEEEDNNGYILEGIIILGSALMIASI